MFINKKLQTILNRVYQQQNMLFNWISRCWGGMGISTQFEKARINCCIADWTVPYEDDVLILITSFQDKNAQIPAKSAINVFLSHLQTDEQRAHPAFLLKHLYVLDHCVQQMTALDIIGYYYNSNLTASKSHKNIELSESYSPLRQLINSYYSYLITKARNYSHYENTYFCKELKPLDLGGSQAKAQVPEHFYHTKTVDDRLITSEVSLQGSANLTGYMYSSGKKKKSRECTGEQRIIEQLFQRQTSYNSIFDVIEKCQQIQKCIIAMNKAYTSGNRKVELIKFIFIMCLWTYIRCYVIVSVGVRYLFKKFMKMSIRELQRFIKTFQHFNDEYTGDFITFVQSNKMDIDIFKEINYNELTHLKKDSVKILIEYKDELRLKEEFKKKNALNSLNKYESTNPASFHILPLEEVEQRKIFELPVEVHTKIKENMKIFYKPRKNMDFCLLERAKKTVNDKDKYVDDFEEETMDGSFFEYENNYHERFCTPFDNDGQESPKMVNSKKSQSSTLIPVKTPVLLEKTHSQQQSPLLATTYSQNLTAQNPQSKQASMIANDQQQKQKLTRMQILGCSTESMSTKPIKPNAMNEIREMFEVKGKRDYRLNENGINEAWDDWENQFSDQKRKESDRKNHGNAVASSTNN